MRKYSLLLALLACCVAYSQETPTPQRLKEISDSVTAAEAKKLTEKDKNKSNKTNSASDGNASQQQTVEGPNNTRISFIAGVGVSTFFRSLYIDPIINPTNNFVQLQYAQKLKTNLTLGIAYTPYTQSIISTVSTLDAAGNIVATNKVENVPRGFTGAAFINPVLFSKISENQNFFTSPDFGFGAGKRFAGGVSLLGTVEFFWVRQPRDWFIDQYKGNNTAYIVNGAPQKSIDLNDNNIFSSKPVVTFGVKAVVTFDIIKSFTSTTTSTFNISSASTSSNARSDSTQSTIPKKVTQTNH